MELPYDIKPSACGAKPAGQRLELKLAKENRTQRWNKISEPVSVFMSKSVQICLRLKVLRWANRQCTRQVNFFVEHLYSQILNEFSPQFHVID